MIIINWGKLSFKYKLIITMVVILVLSIGAFGYLQITGAADAQEENIFQANYELANALAGEVEQSLANLEETLAMLGDFLIYTGLDEDIDDIMID